MISPKEREKLARQFKGAANATGVLFLISGILGIADAGAVYFPGPMAYGAEIAYLLVLAGVLELIGGILIITGANLLPKGKLESGIPAGLALGLLGFMFLMPPTALAVIAGHVCLVLYAALILGLIAIILGLVLVLSPVMTLVRTFLFPTPPK